MLEMYRLSEKTEKELVYNKDSNEMYQDSDGDLWCKLKAGDPRAFEKMYRSYVQVAYNYGRKLTDDTELIEDCIQDIFTDIWRMRENLGEILSIQYYLYASVKRRILKEQRKRDRYLEAFFLYNNRSEDSQPLEKELIVAEDNKTLRNNLKVGFQSLSHVQKKAIFLKFYKNLSYQEVADKMSLSVGNIYKIISRGLKILEKNIDK